jgi:hypothetical protein
MRKILIILALLALSIQTSYATVSAYCQEERQQLLMFHITSMRSQSVLPQLAILQATILIVESVIWRILQHCIPLLAFQLPLPSFIMKMHEWSF